MRARRETGSAGGVSSGSISRRRLLAASGLVAAGGLSGCLGRVASAVTNTESSPAAAFAGRRTEGFSVGDPRVSRLTPVISAESRGASAAVELEGWVTSSAVVAANYNNTRSNRSTITGPDGDLSDDELKGVLEYLDGEAVVAERFTVCLPDAEVPGGNGSIEEAVTPQRLVDYMTGRLSGDGRVYSWGDPDSDGDGIGDCDDEDVRVSPGGVCGSPHLSAAVSAPVATGGSLGGVRADDGTVVVINTPPTADGGPSAVRCSARAGSDGPESSTEAVYAVNFADVEWTAAAGGDDKASPLLAQKLVSHVVVQPPGCPSPFPALLYVGRVENGGQLLYSGGWVIDDAALYENSVTVLTMRDGAPVVGVDHRDLDSDGDGILDALEGGDSGDESDAGARARRLRGARLDTGTVEELVETGVLSAAVKKGYDAYIGTAADRGAETAGDAVLTHLALDAPVLHLASAEASNEVKFKAGAELSKSVN